jgi:hypothetical protein
MSNMGGVVLVLVGVSVGAYALVSGEDGDASASVPAAVVKGLRTAAAPPAPDPSKAPSVAEVPRRVPVGEYTPSSRSAPDRLGLTREIQLQLKRVGCYQGEINGVWSPSVSRAMKAFTDHVNAALPVEQPDIILLALVQNHRDKAACGRGCPAGQGLAGDGRCLPNAHIASAAEKKTPAGTASIALSQAVFKLSSGRPAAKGRMSLAGPALLPAGRGYKEARKGPTTQPRNMGRPVPGKGGNWRLRRARTVDIRLGPRVPSS